VQRGTLLVALVLAPALGCYSSAQIRASSDIIKGDIERARRSNAMRCAPRELASAEANLDFALGELDQGNSSRAHDHILDSETASKKALSFATAVSTVHVRWLWFSLAKAERRSLNLSAS